MSLFKRLALNTKGRDFIVGDLHGELSKLEQLLASVQFQPLADRLIAVGDLVDRGPESDSVLAWLDRPWFHTVMGNHEFMSMLAASEGQPYIQHHVQNGGAWLQALGPQVQLEYAQAFATLPLAIEIETLSGPVGVVHADVPHGVSWPDLAKSLEADERDYADTLLWCRKRIDAFCRGEVLPNVEGLSQLYVGHTPLRNPITLGNVSYIDGGACFGGSLILIDVAAGEIAASVEPQCQTS